MREGGLGGVGGAVACASVAGASHALCSSGTGRMGDGVDGEAACASGVGGLSGDGMRVGW